MIVLVLGLPASGKSYFATRLAKKLGAKYLGSDRLRKQLLQEPRYTTEEKERIYAEMQRQTSLALSQKEDVVLDATFYKEELRSLFAALARNEGTELIYIEVRTTEAIARQRLNRPRKDSDADYEVYKKVKEEFEPLRQEHLVLQSTEDNIDEMLEKAMKYIKR